MIALVQRVAQARVEVQGAVVGAIGAGLLVFVCAERTDTAAIADSLAAKLLRLRLFADETGRMNRSLAEVGGGLLVVSQFTLGADLTGGNRPSYSAAAPAELGRRLYDRFIAAARALHPGVESGVFGADMQVHLVNDGPVTIPVVWRGSGAPSALQAVSSQNPRPA